MRDKKEFIGMNKSSIVSQLKSFKDSIVHGPPHYKMTDLVDENKISWAFKNLMHLGNTHYKPYPPYMAMFSYSAGIPGLPHNYLTDLQ